MNKEFDPIEWEKTCDLYRKNREGCGFTVDVHVVDGHLKVVIKNLREEYKGFEKRFYKMISSVASGGVMWAYHVFMPSYVYNAEDADTEARKLEKVLEKNMEIYLQVLLQQGIKEFSQLLNAQYDMLKYQYVFQHLKFRNGGWMTPKEERWEDGAWVNPDGTTYWDSTSEFLKNVLK